MTVTVTRTRKALLITHVAASTALLGVALVLVALGVAGARGADPRTVYPAAYTVEVWLTAPLAVVALATGIAQAVRHRWRWWVVVKLTDTAIFTGALLAVIIPRYAEIAATATAGATFPDAQRVSLAVVPAVAAAVLVLNVALGVLRPGRNKRAADVDSVARPASLQV